VVQKSAAAKARVNPKKILINVFIDFTFLYLSLITKVARSERAGVGWHLPTNALPVQLRET
jgi:hypothetical protein